MAASGALTSALRLFTEAVFTNIDTVFVKELVSFFENIVVEVKNWDGRDNWSRVTTGNLYMGQNRFS